MAITVDGRVQYAGRVLEVGCHVDSLWEQDRYFAVVLNDAGEVERVSTGVRPWMMAPGGYRIDESNVDATEDVLNAARAIVARAGTRDAAYESAQRAATVLKGKRIQVVKGRKVPVGTAGECIWLGDGQYGKRVGLKDDGGLVHWTSLENVEVANQLDYVGDWAEFEATGAAVARNAYPCAAKALEERRAAGTGEFAVDPFRQAMTEAVATVTVAPEDTALDAAFARKAARQAALYRRLARVAAWVAADVVERDHRSEATVRRLVAAITGVPA